MMRKQGEMGGVGWSEPGHCQVPLTTRVYSAGQTQLATRSTVTNLALGGLVRDL